MKSSNSLRAAVALALGLAASPAFADDAALKAEIDALRAQMQEQAKLLEAQQKKLEELTRKLEDSQVRQQVAKPAEPAKASAVEAPSVALNNVRPVITSADGKSSIALRANVQMDGALYGESAEGPLATDFRRGS